MAGSPLSEDALIARYFAPIAGEGGLALTDDAATVALPAGHAMVVTADALVAGVHFFADDPAAAVARKALRVNLSDLAAKGAAPLGFLLTLALPPGWTEAWLAAFAGGLADDATRYGSPLIGGDTVRTPGPLTLSITAFGSLPAGTMVLRSGARAGDAIAVTGTIGDAALGLIVRKMETALQDLSGEQRGALVDRYLHPEPRTTLASALRAHAHAAMDVSDGLVGDLAKLVKTSGVSAKVDLERVPLSDAVRAALAIEPKLFDVAVTGGDDYEIVMTLPSGRVDAMREAAETAGVALTVIGEIVAGTVEPLFFDRSGPRRFDRGSFQHF